MIVEVLDEYYVTMTSEDYEYIGDQDPVTIMDPVREMNGIGCATPCIGHKKHQRS